MMKKLLTKDTLILVALFALMLAWGPFYTKFLAPPAPKVVAPTLSTNGVETVVTGATQTVASLTEAKGPATLESAPAQVQAAVATPRVKRGPEHCVELTNGWVRLTLSSYGGSLKSVELPAFSMTRTNHSPVVLDFGESSALAYEGLPGLDMDSEVHITVVSNGVAKLEAEAPSGLHLVRTITLGSRYEVTIEDRLINTGREAVLLPAHHLTMGAMGMLPGESRMSGVDFLSLDTLATGSADGVRHWSSKRWFSDDLVLADLFQEQPRRGAGCVNRAPMTHMLPTTIRESIRTGMDWVAVKNKFFVQILGPREGSDGCDLIVERMRLPTENPADPNTWSQAAVPSRVAAALSFPEKTLAPGAAVQHLLSYYVGPKEMSAIAPLGHDKKQVMDFGKLRIVCEGLLWSLNKIYWLIPNYGVAIILLTLLVRVLFWPLTHKGTESMKRMQALQPKIKELQEKYRDKPQKLQQETMALYRDHKVNPLGGCLPMLVQIPVFIALFSVLRSAVELRYAPFLWIGDLSEAENLLVGISPIPINLLPLLMTATQIWQQKLTPAAGDPAQQKMMMWMMPIMMLFFLYSMPSALVLYWTANQVMMIIQLYWQRRLKKA